MIIARVVIEFQVNSLYNSLHTYIYTHTDRMRVILISREIAFKARCLDNKITRAGINPQVDNN